MTTPDEIKKLITDKLPTIPQWRLVLAVEVDGHVDYSQANFYKLNPNWRGKEEAFTAYLEWMHQSSAAYMDGVRARLREQTDSEGKPF